MSKVLVLYYSSYGHLETMASAVAEGARSAGAVVDIKRVPETAPTEVAKAAHFKLEQAAPVASIADLEHYDAIDRIAAVHGGRPNDAAHRLRLHDAPRLRLAPVEDGHDVGRRTEDWSLFAAEPRRHRTPPPPSAPSMTSDGSSSRDSSSGAAFSSARTR